MKNNNLELTELRSRLYGSYVTSNKGMMSLGARADSASRTRNLRYFQHQLRPWLADVSRTGTIADLGCGSGFLLDVLKSLGFTNLRGVDVSSEQVKLARQQHPEVVEGDIFEFLENSVGEYDVLFAFDVVEHLTRSEALAFCDLCHRALKPGGVLILQMPNGDAPLVGPVFNGDLTHERLLSPHSLRHLLGATGFELAALQEHGPVALDLKSAARTLAWRLVRTIYACLHIIETGGTPSKIYSRVFRAMARRKE
jgi:SAM-dependent methyltransferase